MLPIQTTSLEGVDLRTPMSALPPKADIRDAQINVRFGPIADILLDYSIISSARACSAAGTVRPRSLAVFRLM